MGYNSRAILLRQSPPRTSPRARRRAPPRRRSDTTPFGATSVQLPPRRAEAPAARAAYYCPCRCAPPSDDACDTLDNLRVSVHVDQARRSVGWSQPLRAPTEAELDQALIAAPLGRAALQRRGLSVEYERHYERSDGWRVRDFMTALLDAQCRMRAAKAGADGRLWEGQLAFQGALHVCNGSSPGLSALFA